MTQRLKARLEALGPSFVKTIEEAAQGTKALKCPSCEEVHEYKIPTNTALRAAMGGLDRIGLGPTSTTVVRPGAPEGGDLQVLMNMLVELPYGERCQIAKAILPEHSELLADVGLKTLLDDGDSPADATN